MIETQDGYDFEIYKERAGEDVAYGYIIYAPIRSSSFFGAQQEARFAAIGHITLLKRENKND